MKDQKIKVASMFAGIGGICLGFKQAGFNIVWANEIDKDACKTYRHNFGDEYLVEGDIKKIDPSSIPNFDVLTAGFPCQSFSIAGKQRGFNDDRGQLFFEVERIVKAKQPKVIFLENVENLTKHDDGKTFSTIYATLAQHGYCARYEVLNAKDFGVPQQRSRVFLIAFKDKDMCDKFRFPQKAALNKNIKSIVDLSVKQKELYYYDSHLKFEMLKKQMDDNSKFYRFTDYGFIKQKDGCCPTLIASMGTMKDRVPLVKDDYGIRKLTEWECLKLQGFPMEFRFPKETSIEKAYKQIGNSVCVPIIKLLAEEIAKCFKS